MYRKFFCSTKVLSLPTWWKLEESTKTTETHVELGTHFPGDAVITSRSIPRQPKCFVVAVQYTTLRLFEALFTETRRYDPEESSRGLNQLFAAQTEFLVHFSFAPPYFCSLPTK